MSLEVIDGMTWGIMVWLVGEQNRTELQSLLVTLNEEQEES